MLNEEATVVAAEEVAEGDLTPCPDLPEIARQKIDPSKKIDDVEYDRSQPLGSGGYGEVFKGSYQVPGEDRLLTIVVKQFAFDKKGEESSRKYAAIEANINVELMKNADYPSLNITEFFGFTEEAKAVNLVMEFLSGGSLWGVREQVALGKNAGITWKQRFQFALDMARGMAYLHASSVLHRDLKPDNVLLDSPLSPNTHLKLCDFGVSKLNHDKTLTLGLDDGKDDGVRVGTLKWMAPEVLDGLKNIATHYSRKHDMFSLSNLFWFLLSGREPFSDKRESALVNCLVNKKMRETIPKLDEEKTWFKTLIEEGWAVVKSDRPFAEEVVETLENHIFHSFYQARQAYESQRYADVLLHVGQALAEGELNQKTKVIHWLEEVVNVNLSGLPNDICESYLGFLIEQVEQPAIYFIRRAQLYCRQRKVDHAKRDFELAVAYVSPAEGIRQLSGEGSPGSGQSGLSDHWCVDVLSHQLLSLERYLKQPSDMFVDPQHWQVPFFKLKVERVLNQAGENVVYLGEQAGRSAVIKAWLLEENTSVAVDQIGKDIACLGRLRAPEIVQLFGVCQEPHQRALVMEYLSGGSLYDKIPNRVWQATELLNWLMMLTRGLDYLHREDFLHRKLSSHHVLISERGLPKLSGFGFSSFYQLATASSRPVRQEKHRAWTAPEVRSLAPQYSRSSDVYSLAIIFWEMMTRCSPYSVREKASAGGNVSIEEMHDRRPGDIPRDMDDAYSKMINDCWLTGPADRPTTAHLLERLSSHHIHQPSLSAEDCFLRADQHEKDEKYAEAYADYDRAAQAGLTKAHRYCADLILKFFTNPREGVPKDKQVAAEHLSIAAEQNDQVARYNLACMYRRGDGVEQDLEKALILYRAVVNQADGNLGGKYRERALIKITELERKINQRDHVEPVSMLRR